MSNYPITQNTVKVLRFISKHQNCNFGQLKSVFGDLDEMELVNLCLTEYLICSKPGRLPTNFSRGSFEVSPEDSFWATPKTIEFLENRFQTWLQWVIPVCVSGIAVIISAIALIVSLLPRVTEVRLIP